MDRGQNRPYDAPVYSLTPRCPGGDGRIPPPLLLPGALLPARGLLARGLLARGLLVRGLAGGGFLLAACGPEGARNIALVGGRGGPEEVADAPGTADTAPGEASPPVTEEDAGGMDADLDGWIFSDERIHAIDITLPASSIDALYADPYTSAVGAVTFDGEAVPDIGVRLRGKIGSFRDLSGKPKFALDFNTFVPGQRFYGLESLSLNNSVVDCSYLKESVGYRIFGLAGVPHERTGFATVTVNGAPYGLYVLIETPDDRFLRRAYPDPSGNLYDGKYIWRGGWDYTLLDFNSGVDELFQLEEGVDVGNADIKVVSRAVGHWMGGNEFETGLDSVLDWDEYHRELAVEQWIGHNDGYALNRNNYRVYFDPADGKAEIIPWDLDYAFLYDYEWGMSWRTPAGQIAYGCFVDRACSAHHAAVMGEVLASIDTTALLDWYDDVADLTEAAALADPRRECGAASIRSYRQTLRAWITGQNDTMRTYWGL